MNRNLKIIIGVIAVIILILIVINIVKNKNLKTETVEEESTLSDVKYDEETGEYYILDEDTGEILHTGTSEEELYIYTIDPDYDPKMPDAVSGDEIYEEELEEN